jgi:hypothetical protein
MDSAAFPPTLETFSCRLRAAFPSVSRLGGQLLRAANHPARVHALDAARHTLPFVTFSSPHTAYRLRAPFVSKAMNVMK